MIVLDKHAYYNIPQEYQIIFDKYAFDVHEFVETNKIRKLAPFYQELKDISLPPRTLIYKTPLNDIIHLTPGDYTVAFIVNGSTITNTHMNEVRKLIELEQKYE